MSRIMAGRDSRSVRFVVPDGRIGRPWLPRRCSRGHGGGTGANGSAK